MKTLNTKKNQILKENVIIIMCTTPNDTSIATSIAETLINKKLAACITLIPNVCSLYFWDKNIKKKEEIQLLIKTHKELEQPVFEHIKNNHPYKTPELLTIKISNGELDYLSWIYKNIQQ